MKISADINKVEIVNGKALSGEFNVRDIELDFSEELTSCQNCFLVVILNNGTSIDCPVADGSVEFPCILKPQNVKIGVYAYDVDDNGKISKCYSPEPCNFFIDFGSYKGGGDSPHIPSPSAYTELKALLAKAEQTLNKVTEINKNSTHDQYPTVKAVYNFVNEEVKNVSGGGDSDYTLPIGGDELGGVKNGGNVTINEDGTMTAPESEVTDEQVSSAVSEYLEANPDKVTTVQDGSITRVKIADELLAELGLDANHHLTEVQLETFRCDWDGTENATGSYTMVKPFKTPTYIKINKTMRPHGNVTAVFSSVEDFSADTRNASDRLFWRYYKAGELEPMYMEKVPGYEYCRMLFQTTAIEVTAYYDSYELPISTEKTKAEIGLWKQMDGKTYVAAVVPYKNCKFYLANGSQIDGGQSLTDVYGTSNENIFADTVQTSLYQGSTVSFGTAETDFSTFVHLFKVGEYSEIAEGETWKTFDASAIVGYHPKYLVFPLVRNNCSETTRDAVIAAFRNAPTYTIRGGLSDELPVRIDKFQNAKVKNPLIGKHWLLLGDSLTDWFAGRDYTGEGFASKIALEFDMTFSNIAYEGENLDGGITRLNTYIEGIATGENITPDYITIAYGTNGTGNTIGTVEDSEDTATYPAWVKKAISIIRENFPNAVFGFVLPPQGDWTGVNAAKDIKGNHDAIKAVLETDVYAVPYIDMYTQSGITPDLLPSDDYPNDRIHLRSARSQNLYYHAMRRFMMGL